MRRRFETLWLRPKVSKNVQNITHSCSNLLLKVLSVWAIVSLIQGLIHDTNSHMCFHFSGTNRRPSLERQTTLYDDQYYVDGYYNTEEQHHSIYRYCSILHHHSSDIVKDRCLDLFLYCCHKH